MSDLKPCPFCGGTRSISVLNLFTRDSYRKCDICGAEAPEAKTPEEAAEKWNTRPAEDALKAALKDMCELWESMGKQIPPLLNEQKYLNAKALVGKDTNAPANAPDTNDGRNG